MTDPVNSRLTRRRQRRVERVDVERDDRRVAVRQDARRSAWPISPPAPVIERRRACARPSSELSLRTSASPPQVSGSCDSSVFEVQRHAARAGNCSAMAADRRRRPSPRRAPPRRPGSGRSRARCPARRGTRPSSAAARPGGRRPARAPRARRAASRGRPGAAPSARRRARATVLGRNFFCCEMSSTA